MFRYYRKIKGDSKKFWLWDRNAAPTSNDCKVVSVEDIIAEMEEGVMCVSCDEIMDLT